MTDCVVIAKELEVVTYFFFAPTGQGVEISKVNIGFTEANQTCFLRDELQRLRRQLLRAPSKAKQDYEVLTT